MIQLFFILLFSIGATKSNVEKAKTSSTGMYEFPSDDNQGRVKFEGPLKDGLPHGHGRLFYKNGEKSEGNIFNFQREGCTVFTYPENDEKLRYEGVFSNDQPIFQRIQFRNGRTSNYLHGGIESNFNAELGIKTYPDENEDKQIYKGFFKTKAPNSLEADREPHGLGSLTYKNQIRYSGTFINGEANGVGTLLRYNATEKKYKIFYEGQVQNGKKHGIGDMTYPDGSKYKGTFENEEMTGVGIKTFPENQDEERYEGQIQNGIPMGMGQLKYIDGQIHQGFFINGVLEGTGTIIYAKNEDENNLRYDGQLLNDKPHGTGVMKFINGGEFKGTFENGEIFDFGIYTYNINDIGDEIQYKGQFRDSLPNGIGEMKYKDGSIYQGLFENGKPDGIGAMEYADGSTYKGTFLNGKFHGAGKLTYTNLEDKVFYEGQFQDNLPHGVGLIKYKNGTIYHGELSYGDISNIDNIPYQEQLNDENKLEGHGEIQFADGSKYQGVAKNCELTGIGIFSFAPNDTFDREFYKGEMRNGEPYGYGILEYKNKQIYVGELKNGLPDGSGSLTNKLGLEVKNGLWQHGIYIISEWSKYFYVKTESALTYENAVDYCKNQSGILAEPMDEYEISNIKNSFATHNKQESCWIGLSDLETEGTFQWETSFNSVGVTDWYGGQPDNKGDVEDCVEIRLEYGKKWNDLSCSTLRHGICQFRSVKGYFTSDEIMDFDEASRFCVENGGILAEVHHKFDKQTLQAYLISLNSAKEKLFWLGLTDRETEGVYVWESDESIAMFTDWTDGNPDNFNGNENCIHVQSGSIDRQWNDINCDAKLYPLCQYY